MMEFLKNWITNIVSIMIFVMLLNVLMPNSNMKRFINVIVGLLIIIVIAKPFVMLKDITREFEFDVIETSNFIDSPKYQSKDKLQKLQQTEVVESFKRNFEDQIKSFVATNGGIEKGRIQVSTEIAIDESETRKINIEHINVKILEKSSEIKEVNSVSIGSIEINNNKNVINGDKAEYNFNDNKYSKQLRQAISQYFGVNQANIAVEVQMD